MTKILKAIHANHAAPQPRHMLADTAFSIGDILQFPYYVHTQPQNVTGYQSALFSEGREVPGHFLVSDLFICTLTAPPCVYVELTALDPYFRMLYPVEHVMLLPESELMHHLQNHEAT